jgi:hypothetical protein
MFVFFVTPFDFFGFTVFGFEQQAEYSFPSITVLAFASTHGLSGFVGVQ